MNKLILILSIFSNFAWAQCPGEDAEPALTVTTKSGRQLYVCGFEDRDVSAKGKRAFADFTIFSDTVKAADGDQSGASAKNTASAAQKVFSSDPNETYWLKPVPGSGVEIEELWFFSEKPQPAVKQIVECEAEACKLTEPKCVLKMKVNPFPKALPEFQKQLAAGSLGDNGEDLIDKIFAQALLGDKSAKSFFEKPPEKLGADLEETFQADKRKLEGTCKR